MTSSYCPQISISDWSEPDPGINWNRATRGDRSAHPEKLSVIEEAVRKALSTPEPSLERELRILHENRDDEWDTPTEFAYAFAKFVVNKLNSQILVPFLTTDDRGGIRMIWRSNGRRVIANFGATPESRSYVYYESEIDHDTEPLGADRLTNRLRWLGQ